MAGKLGEWRGPGEVVAHCLPELIAVGRDVCLISRPGAKRCSQAPRYNELVDVIEKIPDPVVAIMAWRSSWGFARLAEGHLPPKHGFPDSPVNRASPNAVHLARCRS